MARLTTKNFQSALRYYFASRFGFLNEIGVVGSGGQYTGPNVDHDLDNNKALTWADPTDTFSVSGIAVDSDGRVHTAQQTQLGVKDQQSFYLNANAGLATQTFFIADKSVLITGIEYVHSTAGTDSGAVTANITHETGTQAPGTGTAVQVGTFNCKGTINVVQYAALLAVTADGAQAPALTLAAGDRLSIVFTGTLTTLAGVVVTVATAPGFKEECAIYNVNANATIATQGFFLSNRDMLVTGVQMIWSAPGTDSSAVTIDVTQESSTTAPGSGTTILTAAQSVKGAANTVVAPALSATAANLKVLAGNRLSIKTTGTLTGLAGLVVVVYLQAYTPNAAFGYYGQVDANFNLQANSTQGSQAFFIADRDYEVVDGSVVYSAAGTDGGSVTGDIVIAKGTTAPGSGTTVMSAANSFNLKSTANTVQVGTLSVSRRARLLSQGDRLAFVTAGTLTTLAGVDVTVSLIPR